VTLVLLPPSAGKAQPDGPPVDLAELAFADVLTKPRDRLLRALRLTDAPAAPAAEVYTGVLYRQLGLPDLADRWDRVLIASALFGVVAPGDRICAYTLDMGSKVPRLRESLTAFWRRPLARALPDAGLIVDLRSGSYAAAWKPRHATVLGVRGFTVGPDGSRKVITHMAKRVRGDVARLVLQSPTEPETPGDVAAIAAAGGLEVELNGDYLDVLE
jgi:cytoplasmic iron level regulating protein YaaA (DUF328/UPF0246 family)